MDAIALLRNDHRAVERLFKEFEKAGPKAHKTRRQVADRIVKELSVHAAIEEQLFYPAVRQAVPETDDDVLEGLEEHHIVKWTLSEVDGMDPEHERFVPKMTVLMESVRHHVTEEEGELFPTVRGAMTRKQLTELGDLMAQAKEIAPTGPHPKAPDTPPAGATKAVASTVRKAATVRKKAAAVKKKATSAKKS
ncbi:MAG TPA: hemerythrin domain-containing protein [Acidimicrobiales bacterium]|jgi:hemerythrin superfamily protein|nr:hemerythrin domain-containing protein [Acidimicrobiales bacterium]